MHRENKCSQLFHCKNFKIIDTYKVTHYNIVEGLIIEKKSQLCIFWLENKIVFFFTSYL